MHDPTTEELRARAAVEIDPGIRGGEPWSAGQPRHLFRPGELEP